MKRSRRQTVKGSAQRFKTIRTQLELSQSQFAKKLGVAANTVARWERGYLVPSKLAELAAEYLLLRSQSKRIKILDSAYLTGTKTDTLRKQAQRPTVGD